MTTRSSRVGFGRGQFGEFNFGFGDWAEILLWNYLPEIYRVKDAERPNHELRGFIDSIKPPFQELREKIEVFLDLRDPSRVPLQLLPFLANDVGLVDDPGQVESRRRSAVFDAFLLFLNKGTAKGYTIIGAFNNVQVAVEPLWEGPCDSLNFGTAPPNMFVLSFDDVSADIFGESVNVKNYRGNQTVAQINALAPASGDSYVVTNSGTLTAGALVVSAGDLVQFDGLNWVLIALNVGGFPYAGTRAHIANLGVLQSPLTTVADNGKVASWDGTSLTPAIAISVDEGFFDDFLMTGGETILRLRFTSGTEPVLLTIDEVVLSEQEQLFALAGQTVLTLPYNGSSDPRLASIGKVLKNSAVLKPGTDFSFDIVAGTLTLNTPAASGDVISFGAVLQLVASFTPSIALGQVTLAAPTSFEEFFTAGGETRFTLQFNGTSTPLLASVVSVTRNGTLLAFGVDYTVDLINGFVNLIGSAGPQQVYRVVETTVGAVRGKRYRVRSSVNVNTDLLLTDQYELWPIPLDSAPYVTSPGVAENYAGNRTVAQINLLTPTQTDAYVVTTAGVITPGNLLVSIGDLVGFFDGAWEIITPNVGGLPPAGTLVRVSSTTLLTPPLTNGVDTGRVVKWNGTSLTPIFIGVTSVDNYLGNKTTAQVNALIGPKSDDAYVMLDGGTITAGALVVSKGDLVRFNGTIWTTVVAGSGGAPPSGTLARVSLGGVMVTPVTAGVDDGKFARWDGTSTTPVLLASFSFEETFTSTVSPLQLEFNDSTEPRLVRVDELSKNGTPLVAGVDYTVEPVSGTVTLTVAPVPTDVFKVLMVVEGVRARTNRLILHLSRIDGAQSELPAGTDEIIQKISDFKPAHVVFDSFTYDVNVPLSFAPSIVLEIP